MWEGNPEPIPMVLGNLESDNNLKTVNSQLLKVWDFFEKNPKTVNSQLSKVVVDFFGKPVEGPSLKGRPGRTLQLALYTTVQWCGVAQLGCGVAKMGAAWLRRVRRGSEGCGVAKKGAAWLRRVWRGSDSSAPACCKADPSKINKKSGSIPPKP